MADDTTTAGFPQQAQVDRSAAGLSYQGYSMAMQARGAALGKGRRIVPDPSAQFSHPPVSSAQFGHGGNAKEPMTGPGEA